MGDRSIPKPVLTQDNVTHRNMNICRLVGLLGWEIDPCQGLHLHRKTNTQKHELTSFGWTPWMGDQPILTQDSIVQKNADIYISILRARFKPVIQ
jgi:hypothetical protein